MTAYRHCDCCGVTAMEGETDGWRSLDVCVSTGPKGGSTEVLCEDLCRPCQRKLFEVLCKFGFLAPHEDWLEDVEQHEDEELLDPDPPNPMDVVL